MQLILVRHGQTPSNLLHALDTAAPGPGLTDLGHAQAQALGVALGGTGIEAVFTSHLVRTQLTARPLLTTLGVEAEERPGIAEIVAGDLEMRTDREAHDIYLTTGFAWATGDLTLRMPGGESGQEMLARFDSVVEEVADLGLERVALVTHGAVARVWAAARGRDVDVERAATHPLRNTCRITFEGDPARGWRLLEWDVAPPGVDVGWSAQRLHEEEAEDVAEEGADAAREARRDGA